MKFNIIVLVILFIPKAYSFDKDFNLINDKTPYEFSLLFESLKQEIKTPSEKIRFIGLAKDLNNHLGFLQKEHIFMLIKSEIIKTTLEYKFPKIRQFDVNTHLILRLEESYESKKSSLRPFSKWIWQSIIAELNYRKKMGLITANTFNPNLFEGNKRQEALRLQRYFSYLIPWVDQMDNLDAPQFNQLAKDLSWLILERINDRSILFKRYASTSAGDTQTTLINIPQKLLDLGPEEIKEMQNNTLPLSLSEQSKVEKAKAKKETEAITPMDMSTISDDLAQELDKQE